MMDEPIGTTILSLLFNLSIPAFGYLGARDGSATLMCIFVGLMMLNAANAVAVLAMVAYAVASGMPQRQADGTYEDFHMTATIWVQVILILGWAIMAIIAAYHSNKLCSKLSQGEAIAERYNDDPEIGLPEIDTKLDMNDYEPPNQSFGLPEKERRPAALDEDSDMSPSSVISRRQSAPRNSFSPRELKHISSSE
jgi:hypothetical protein